MDIDKSSFKLFLSNSGISILRFVGILFFARYLEPQELGIFFIFQALLGLLSIPADFGIRGALEKRLSEGMEPNRTLGAAFALKTAAFILVAIGILAFRGSVNRYIGRNLAWLLVVGLGISELARLYLHVVRGELRVGETAPIQFVQRFVWFGLGVILVLQGLGAQGIILGLIAGWFVALLWAYHTSDTSIGPPSWSYVRSLFDFSKYNVVTIMGGRIYSWVDLAFIGLLLAPRYVSAYEIAWQVTLLVILISKSIAITIFPEISRLNAEAAIEEITAIIGRATGFALFFSVPALIGASIFANEILTLIFGQGYAIAATVLVVLMVEKLFQSVNDIVERSVRAIDRPDLAARATVVGIGLNVVLNPLFIIWFGFVGAAVATTVSWAVNTLLHAWYLSRFVSIDFPLRLFSWFVLASLVMGGLLIALKSVAPVRGAPLLFLEIGIGIALYMGITVSIPSVRQQIILPGVRVLTDWT